MIELASQEFGLPRQQPEVKRRRFQVFSRVLSTVAICLTLAGQSLMAHDPHDPIVTVVASPNFAQDSTVFAATGYLSVKLGVYALLQSTNAGVTWSPVAGLPSVQEMYTIVFSPAYALDQTIYVAGVGGLYMTTNKGVTWTDVYTSGLLNVAVSPNFATDNTLFIVTSKNTVYESTNRGTTFTEITLPTSITSALTVIAVSPNFDADNTLMLGTASNGIYRTISGGASWVSVTSQPGPSVTSIVFSPGYSSDHTIFASASQTAGTGPTGGVLVSTNKGATWSFSNSGLSDTNANSITLSPNYLQDGTLWVATADTPPATGGVFQSTNQGGVWVLQTPFNRELSDLTTSHYQDVAAANGASGIALFLAAFEGLWTSPSGTISWQYIDTFPTRLVRHLLLSPNYASDQTLFGNTYGGGNLWSTTGGATWAFKNSGMSLSYTDAAAISPNFANDQTAFSSVYAFLEQTTNGGSTWQAMFACCVGDTVGTKVNTRGLALSPNFANDKTVLIGTDNDPDPTLPPYVCYLGTCTQYPSQGVFLSTDGGNQWIPTSLGGPPVVSIAISPGFATDKTAFAATLTKGVYKSTDGGMTWAAVTLPAPSLTQIAVVVVSPAFPTDQTVFVAPVTGGLLKSTNGGSTWTVLPRTTNLLVMDLQLSPNYASDQTFFAATIQAGVMKSTNGGTTMLPESAFPDTFVTAIGVSPNFASDHTVFAAAYHSIYRSVNGGAAWTDTVEPGRIEETRTVYFATAVGQPPPTISYHGTWTSTSQPAASTSAFVTTTTAENTAVLNFTGTGVQWLSVKGPRQGSATVTLDGVLQATVDLNTGVGTTNQYQQVVWNKQGLTCAPHTVTITAMPPKAGQPIALDAFDVWIDACPEAKPRTPQQ
jgi:photosystem II stability/assembly factor-like uncharacterized protein